MNVAESHFVIYEKAAKRNNGNSSPQKSPSAAEAADGTYRSGMKKNSRKSPVDEGRFSRKTLCLYLPLLVLAIAAAPCVNYQLPSYQSHLGEDYQPLDTLKFCHSRGHSFQRYGVFPNFLLAPGYALSLGYWKITGQWSQPTEEFPFGLARPLEQMGFLLWQGRLLFLILGLILLQLHQRLLLSRESGIPAVALAFGFCVGMNPVLALHMANTRPDGIALCLTALALGLYHRMLRDGMTARLALWFSVVAVGALSSKELAAFMFVIPCAVLCAVQLFGQRPAIGGSNGSMETHSSHISLWQRSIPVLVLLGTGIGGYLLVNVIYAPEAWWARMQYWLGPGADKEVFATTDVGTLQATWQFAGRVLAAVLNNLGPAGVPATLVALFAAFITSPRTALLASLPLISVLVLFLLPLGYAQDRYYLYVALGLVAPTAIGWEAMLRRTAAKVSRPILVTTLTIAIVINLSYTAFAWIALPMRAPYMIEHHVVQQNRINDDETVYLLTYDVGPQPPGKHRLASLGVRWDHRSLQEIVDASPADRPAWIYAHAGALAFIDGATTRPSRAEYLRQTGALESTKWRGVEALGYVRTEELVPNVPRAFVWRWMPAVKDLQKLERVIVFRPYNNRAPN